MSGDCSQEVKEHESDKNTDVFVHRFKQLGKEFVLKVPIQLPLDTTVEEFAYRIINCHSIACYNENGKLRYIYFRCILFHLNG